MPRLLNRLGNSKQVAAIKEPGWHGDGGGLYLRIQGGGARSWVMVDTRGGKRTEKGLGPASSITLAQARDRRDNPVAEASGKPAPLFGDWSDSILGELLPGFKNEKHRTQWTHSLKAHAAAIRPLAVDEIDVDDILAVLRPIWRVYNETARRLRGRIERILDAAKAAGHISAPYENPARWKANLEHFLIRKRKSEKGHHAAMPWQDVPAFVATLRARRRSTSAEALEFTILTAARTGETIGATWREIDLKAKVWTVPKDRMKMEIEHQVPLSDAAMAVLERMGVARGPDDFVFPGGRANRPLSSMAMLRMLKVKLERPETVHGFRSSFRDWAGDATSHPRELAEMALAHAVGDDTEQAYRRAFALEKRRVMMADWANYIGGDAK